MKDEIFRTSLHTSYNPTGSPSGMPMANATAIAERHTFGERSRLGRANPPKGAVSPSSGHLQSFALSS